jgi:hypothetical protein
MVRDAGDSVPHQLVTLRWFFQRVDRRAGVKSERERGGSYAIRRWVR